jgi:hypothetical protein
MRPWISYVLFFLAAVGFLAVVLFADDMRYRQGDEFIEQFIEEDELEKAVSEGWLPYHLFAIDYRLFIDDFFDLYEEKGVDFFLRYLKSGDNTKTALALRILQFAMDPYRGIAGWGDHERDVRVYRGLSVGRERILAWEDVIAAFMVSENTLIRQEAVELFAKIGTLQAAVRLKKLIDSELPVEIRASAVKGLGTLQDTFPYDENVQERVEAWIEGYFDEKEPEIRLAAISSLKDTSYHVQLFKHAQADNDIRVRTIAALQLLDNKIPCNMEILMSAMKSELVEKEIRYQSALELGFKGFACALPELLKLAEDPALVKPRGEDVSHLYGMVACAFSEISGTDFVPYWETRLPADEYWEKTKNAAMAWWEKHKHEVLEKPK